MIKAEELRIGNLIRGRIGYDLIVDVGVIERLIKETPGYEPITLTEELLVMLGFELIPHFTVLNSYVFDIGRCRQISIGCTGTPNEMLWLQQFEDGNKRPTDLICLHNWDYDGPLYLHRLQNIIHSLNTTVRG